MTAQTLTLADFLLQRIAEDERHARKLAETDTRPVLSLALTVNHPQRILLECEAKRRIVERETERLREQWRRRSDEHRQTFDEWMQPPFGETLRDLATVYRDHPDYNPDWRP